MRRAIFGGSFDPVHNGHVSLASELHKALQLDEVIVMPTGVSPFKKDMKRRPASGADRLEMCRLAFADMHFAMVSDHEISQKGVSYTVDTVRHFHGLYPNDELFLLVGGDMLMSFDRWKSWQEILSLCNLAAVSRERDGTDMDNLEKKAAELRRFGKVIFVKTEPLDISSTEIREKIIKNCDISCYVPQNVVKYILENRLYQE
ncbi:MAG: nicotinate (nicotinamide) nucleotide adenylyltransferase [Oscillospiraceae bacterium]|nr:nicotinate (nicotinamide) nucleotide adenylyltransferase [Oscillospiraceae bacterium]MDE7279618.1 nicotinate (nicotinamide) nucleotide adenylyltransferase [Oscillospiraceae bacterium]